VASQDSRTDIGPVAVGGLIASRLEPAVHQHQADGVNSFDESRVGRFKPLRRRRQAIQRKFEKLQVPFLPGGFVSCDSCEASDTLGMLLIRLGELCYFGLKSRNELKQLRSIFVFDRFGLPKLVLNLRDGILDHPLAPFPANLPVGRYLRPMIVKIPEIET
jgi:hypothetical protein